MKYFIIDDLGIRHPYPSNDGGSGTATSAVMLEKTYTAGQTIGIGKLLMVNSGKVFYFDPADESNAGKAVGIASVDAAINTPVTVVSAGVYSLGGWGLLPGQVYYAGPMGTIISTAPVSGICQQVGVAIDTTTLKIELSEPIILI